MIGGSAKATERAKPIYPTKDTTNNSLLVDFLRARSFASPVVQCADQDYPVFGVDIKVYNLGKGVNSPFSDYNPVLDKKETFMLFTSRRQIEQNEVKDVDGQYFEKMFVSRRENGVFTDAQPITQNDSIFGRLPSSERHESLIFLSYSEDMMITYTNEKLYYSNRIGNFYTEPVEFPEVINKGKWKRHASITEDGRTLYFTTESKSSVNKNLNLDIWEVQRNDDGSWKKPRRLEDIINSPYNEDSPEISPDGRFLFFSSNRSGGLGGYDIYMAEKVDGKWESPKNLCEPINTAGDDIYFKLSRNGNYAYYSSNVLGGEGNMDIYKVVLDVPSIATCGSYAYGKRNITFTSPFEIEFYGPGKEFFWAFGDGQTEVGTEVNHEYAVDGDYNVVLYVRDRKSKRVVNTVFSKKVRVDTENSAVEIAGPDTVEIGSEILFNGEASYIDNVPATAFYWKVDGQLVSREPIVNYEFTKVGKHKIELEVGVLDERVMELSSSCIAREIEVITPFEYQQKIGAIDESDGFSFTPLIPDRVLSELEVEEKQNELFLQNDYVKTWEGEPRTISAFDNDRSPGISLDRIVFVSNAKYGSVKVLNGPFGQIKYEPSAGFYGFDKFTYTARDKQGRIAEAEVVVSVMRRDKEMQGQNVTNDLYLLKKKEAVTLFPQQNDEHDLGAEQKIVEIGRPSVGNVERVGLKGLLKYTPNESFQGSDAFTYTVQDEMGKKNTASVVIRMEELKSTDVFANPDYFEINQDEKTRLKVLDNDVLKGNATIVDITPSKHGSAKLINPASGDIYYGPESGFVGSDAFTYTIENNKGERSVANVTIVVKKKVNLNKPLAVETYQYNPVNIFVFSELNIASSFSIFEEPTAQHGVVQVVDAQKGILTYTPNADYTGYDLFYLKVKNGNEVAQLGLVIKVLEQSSLIGKYGVSSKSFALNPQDRHVIDPLKNLSELSQNAQVLKVSGDPSVTQLLDGNKISFEYSKVDQEQYAIAVQTREDNGRVNGTSLLIHPVDEIGIPKLTRMVLTPDVAKTKMNKPVTVLPLSNDRHMKKEQMSISFVDEPMNGTIVFKISDGSVMYVPNLDFKGTDAFTYTVSDESGVKSTSTVSVVVLNETEYALENEGYNPSLKAFNYARLEPDKGFMNPEKIVDATSGMFGSVEVLNAYTGEIQYMPNKGFEGEDRFSFTMQHKDGSYSNHPILAVVEERKQFVEGKRVVKKRVEAFGDEVIFFYPLLNKVHPEGQEMKILSVKGKEGGVSGIINESAFSYQPVAGFEGLDKVTFTLIDENGKKQVNEVYISVKAKEGREDLGDLYYKTPVNIPLKISIKSFAKGYTYIDHTNPNVGSAKVLSKDSLVFEYQGSVSERNDQFSVSLKSPQRITSYINIKVELLPEVNLEMGRSSFGTFSYELLKPSEEKLLVTAASDKGELQYDETAKTFTYDPYAGAKGFDKIEYAVETENGVETKRYDIYHLDYNKLNPNREELVEIKSKDSGKLLIYAFSNLENKNDAGIFINKVKKADEGEVKLLNAELGILEYTPQPGVNRDGFTVQLKNENGDKQEMLFDLKLSTEEEREEKQMLAIAVAKNLKSFNYQMIDFLEEEGLKLLNVDGTMNAQVDVIDYKKGLYTYLPKDGFEGVDYILVEVEDENGVKFTIPVQITVKPVEEVSSKNLTYNNISNVQANRTSYHAVFPQNSKKSRLVSASGAKAGKVSILDPAKGIVTYEPFKGFVGEDTYTFEFVDANDNLFQKEMRVFVRDESAEVISYSEIKRQSESVKVRETNLTEEYTAAVEQSQADAMDDPEAAAQARAKEKARQQVLLAGQQAQKEEQVRQAAMEKQRAQDFAEQKLKEQLEQERQKELAEQQQIQAEEEMAQQERLNAMAQEERKAEQERKAKDKRAAEEQAALAAKKAEEQRLHAAKEKEVIAKAKSDKLKSKEDNNVVFRNILFDFDKSDLRELSEEELNKVYNFLVAHPDKVLQLDGHADWIGTVEYNLALSERRAKRAYNYLIMRGISEGRMVYQYYGEAVPVAPNANPDGTDNPDGRQLNRRCEFNIKTEGTADIIMKF
ncbi:MAG: tandem-95 repeat protein [Salibacteraceae bacterium]